MKAISEGDEGRLWRTYRAEVLGFVQKRVRDKALAEDIVHDVFIKAYTHRGDLNDRGKLRPWLYQITRNTLLDHYRSRKPHDELPPDLANEDGGENSRAERELANCLRPLLRELPAPYRQALALAEFEGLTQQEIASREGLSLSGAKSRVQRARRMLRDRLFSCCRVELGRRGGVIDYEPGGACDPGACRG